MGTDPLFAHARTDNNFKLMARPVDNSRVAINLSPGLLLDEKGLGML